VADGTSGLRVIDVSNPAFPVEIGGLDTPGLMFSVAIAGSLAYAAGTDSPNPGSPGWLRVIDVSDPAFPVEVGIVATPDLAQDVEVVGSLAYVAGRDSGLRIIDVSNPTTPVEIGAYDNTTRRVSRVELVGDLAYVSGYDTLFVIDVSNPALPMELGAIEFPIGVGKPAVVDGLVYLPSGSSGLRIIDFGPEYSAGQCGGPGFDQLNPNSSLEAGVVCDDSLKTYWFSAIAGESYAVRVAPMTGDPNLYGSTTQTCIESLPALGGGCSYESSTAVGLTAEEIQYTAAATGPYYIGVHGITNATYTIEVPEPSRWQILAAGICVLALLYRVRVRWQSRATGRLFSS
jgi:hypothetical protein